MPGLALYAAGLAQVAADPALSNALITISGQLNVAGVVAGFIGVLGRDGFGRRDHSE